MTHKSKKRGGFRHVYTFSANDLGRAFVEIDGSAVRLADFFGPVFPADIGKRVYAVRADDPLSADVLQVESDAQRDDRERLERVTRQDAARYRQERALVRAAPAMAAVLAKIVDLQREAAHVLRRARGER